MKHLFGLLLIGLCLVGCQKNPPCYSFTCEPDTLTMHPGETAELTLTLTPKLKKEPVPVYSTLDSLVATVSEDGMVKAVGYGETLIKVRCSFNGYSPLATCLVLVPDPEATGQDQQ